jgi:hypothetical protein
MFNNPSHVFVGRCVFALVGVCILAISGCLNTDSRDSVINDMVKGAEADRAKLIDESAGLCQDYQAFKDPVNPHTLILEWTRAPGAEPKEPINTQMLKQDLVDVFRADKNLVRIVQLGVSISNRYKTADGKVYFEYTVTTKDLE